MSEQDKSGGFVYDQAWFDKAKRIGASSQQFSFSHPAGENAFNVGELAARTATEPMGLSPAADNDGRYYAELLDEATPKPGEGTHRQDV